MPNPVVHWELNAKNAPEAVKFYTELFGWEASSHEGMEYYLINSAGEPGAQGIAGGISGMSDAPPYFTVYVGVDDLQAYLDKAESLGAKTIVPPTPIPGMSSSIAMFADPQGQVFGLYKHVEEG